MVLPNDNVTERTMATEDKMTIDERRKYLFIMRPRYHAADRKERGRLLTEMERVTELDRKTLIRRMRGSLARRLRRQQRGRTYKAAVDDALRVIAESLDYVCAERLTPNLVWAAKHLARHREMSVTPDLLEQLGRISVSTVRRILQRIGQDQPRCPGVAQSRRTKSHARFPCVVFPGTSKSQAILKPIWCTTAALLHRGSTFTLYNSSM